MVGWAPRYLVTDLLVEMREGRGKFETKTVRINPKPAPSKQHVLIGIRGCWSRHEPMSSSDFQPLFTFIVRLTALPR